MSKYIVLCAILTCSLIGAEEFNICDPNNIVINDVEQEDCPSGLHLLYQPGSCVPTCEEVITKKTTVCVENPQPCIPGVECAKLCIPGYECKLKGKKANCYMQETNCLKYHNTLDKDTSNVYYKALIKPSCTIDGKWKGIQLKGEEANGRFYCYSDDGVKLFGHGFSGQEKNMTCACSRRKYELEKDAAKNWFVTLHCDYLGNYEPLQCNFGQCWCAEAKTGRLTSQMVPESAMKLLPCYDEKSVGSQYLRQCESQLYAETLILRELRIHGTKDIEFNPLMCDPDGSYGPLKVQGGQVYCVWKDNTNLGSFSAQTSVGMDCICARDTKLFELNGLQQKSTCGPNGNYLPYKITSNNKFYCVDSDGFQNDETLFDDVEQAYQACQNMVA